MIESRDGIRKVAILIDSLDEPTAEVLLGPMLPELAARVRAARIDLGNVAVHEREQILAEFLDAGWRPASDAPARPAEACNDAFAEKLSAKPTLMAVPASSRSRDATAAEPVDDPTAALACGLAQEDAQTICLVLARLPPPRAVDLLRRLPGERQAEILQRLTQREQPPEPSGNFAREPQPLACVLKDDTPVDCVPLPLPHLLAPTPPQEPADHDLSELLPPLPRGVEHRQDAMPGEGERGEAPLLTDFDDLVRLEDVALARVFRAAEPSVVLLALSGANRELIDRIVRHLPSAAGRTLRRQIATLGPTRLRDIELAQQQLVELASQMCRERLIHVPRRRRFTMAA